jgi:hypothetical protein
MVFHFISEICGKQLSTPHSIVIMDERTLLKLRLNNQQLIHSKFDQPGDLVKWMGAVQAQDFFGSLWAINIRLNEFLKEADVEKAIVDKTIVRSWPMRGTLHFCAPEDLRWMIKYLTPRVFARYKSILEKDGIDNAVRTKAKKVFAKILEGGNQLTRDEMYQALEKAKVSTKGTRGLHLLGTAAQDGLICFGPRAGKQHTFVLVDEWISSNASMPSKEEAMAELARRYVRSHGPVVVEDFAWWAGLNKGEANAAFQSIANELETAVVNEKEFWLDPASAEAKPKPGKAYLLPTYDEYGIAYKNRDEFIHNDEYRLVGGLFTSAIMMNGKMIGTWRRVLEKKSVHVEFKPFQKFTTAQKKAIQTDVKRYGKFLSQPVRFI